MTLFAETLPVDHDVRERIRTDLDRNLFVEAGAGTGKTRVLVDRVTDESGRAQARTSWQADDVDGVTRVATDAAPGDFVEVELTAVEDDYDFAATVVRVLDRQRTTPRPTRIGRVLPVTTAGSFGR